MTAERRVEESDDPPGTPEPEPPAVIPVIHRATWGSRARLLARLRIPEGAWRRLRGVIATRFVHDRVSLALLACTLLIGGIAAGVAVNTATWEDNRAVMAADLSDAQHTTSGALKRRDDAAKQLRSQADHVPLMEQALAETRDLVSAANLRKLERDIARERASQRRFDAQTAAYRNSRDAWRDRIWWR